MDYSVPCIKSKTKNKTALVRVPGSKSITARALLLATLANGESVLRGAQDSDDCATFLSAVRSLGVVVQECGDVIKIKGCGGELQKKSGEIYVGSAGTAARFLTALCGFSDGQFTLYSSEQMKNRPQEGLINALKSVGASFKFLEKEGCFPFEIRGAKASGKTLPDQVTVDIRKSSQYLSALLISAVCLKKPFTVNVYGQHGLDYVAMTVKMMESFGVKTDVQAGQYTVNGTYQAMEYDIEPDASAACYFYALNRLLNADVKVEGITDGGLQGDFKFIQLIKNFDGGEVNASTFSDQTLTLAAIAPYFSKPTTITGVAHIRVQECDRIRAAVDNLSALGAKVEETSDGLIIYPSRLKGARVKTFGDHRVAMSFALTGLLTEGVVIEGAQVCSKTFRDYFSVLDGLVKALIN